MVKESCYFCKSSEVDVIKTHVLKQEVCICGDCVEKLLLLVNSKDLETNDFKLDVKLLQNIIKMNIQKVSQALCCIVIGLLC